MAVFMLPSSAAGSNEFAQVDACVKTYTQSKVVNYARQVYERPRINKKAREKMARMTRCQLGGRDAQVNVKRAIRRFGKRREKRQQLLALTPYNCGSHGYFAVPCYIVQCESTFNPYADNGSHFGYYQCRYDYECGTRDIAAQHRGAAKLWDGGAGSGHWECA
jgi:hypothetical protein